MGNCLKKELKESVSEDSLLVLDHLQIIKKVGTFSSSIALVVNVTESITVKCRKGQFADSSGTALGETANLVSDSVNTLYFTADEAILDIPKSKIKTLQYYTPKEFINHSVGYMEKCTSIINMNSNEDIANLKDIGTIASGNLKTLRISQGDWYGDIKSLAGYTALINLEVNGNVIGSIEDVAHLTSLNNLLVGKKITGTIEGFVAGQCNAENPRTTGTVTLPYVNGSQVTYQGSRIVSEHSTSISLSWNGTDNITLTV